MRESFEWDEEKNEANVHKHSIDFEVAQRAFLDRKRIIVRDTSHSVREERFFCFGKVDTAIVTVRFAYRGENIRIIGAGYWRKGKRIYEKQNNIHR